MEDLKIEFRFESATSFFLLRFGSKMEELSEYQKKGGSWLRVKMSEQELFWNVTVVFETILIRNRGAFRDILLKRIDTIRLVDWN